MYVTQKAFDPVHCLQKSNSLNNINCEQDTGEMTNYNLYLFVVVFQGTCERVEQAGPSTSFVTGE